MEINNFDLTDKEKGRILAFFKNDKIFSEYSEHISYTLDLYTRLPLAEIRLFINLLVYKKLKTKQAHNLELNSREKIILSKIEKYILNLLNK